MRAISNERKVASVREERETGERISGEVEHEVSSPSGGEEKPAWAGSHGSSKVGKGDEYDAERN